MVDVQRPGLTTRKTHRRQMLGIGGTTDGYRPHSRNLERPMRALTRAFNVCGLIAANAEAWSDAHREGLVVDCGVSAGVIGCAQ
jgi:hypothetical protein